MHFRILELILQLDAAFFERHVGCVAIRPLLRIPAARGVTARSLDSENEICRWRLADIEMLVMPQAFAGAGQVQAAFLPIAPNRFVQASVSKHLVCPDVALALDDGQLRGGTVAV